MSTDAEDRRIFQQIISGFDAPAYIRRARRVEEAWNDLLERCRHKRAHLLEMPCLRLARFFKLTASWSPIPADICLPKDVSYLDKLHREWTPQLRSIVRPARTAAEIIQALADLVRSFERFNRRWLEFVNEIDLAHVNELRDGYNRFYVLEKECALFSSRIARDGFVPLPLAELKDVLEAFPLLKVPHIAES
jgi:hypothetical protein